MSYDSVINNLYDQHFVNIKNSISFNSKTIKYKKLNVYPTWDFRIYNNEEIILTTDQKDELKKIGVDIEEWERGEKLGENGKVVKPFSVESFIKIKE